MFISSYKYIFILGTQQITSFTTYIMTEEQHKHAAVTLERNAATTRTASHYLLALGSTLMIYVICLRKLSEILPYPDITVPVATWLVALIWYFLVEYGLRSNLPYVIAYFMGEKVDNAPQQTNKTRRAVAWITGLAVFFQLLGTGGLSIFSSGYLSESVTQEKDRTEEITNHNLGVSSYDKDVQTLSKLVDDAKSTDQQRIEKTERTAAQHIATANRTAQQRIDDAKNKLGKEYARLADKGNGWAQKKIAPYVNPAKAWAARHIAEAEKWAADHINQAEMARQAPTLSNDLKAYLAKSSDVRDQLTVNLSTTLQKDQEAYESQKADYWWVFAAVNILALLLHIISSGLVIACRIERKGPILDEEMSVPAALRLRVSDWYRRNLHHIMPKTVDPQLAVNFHNFIAGSLPSMPHLQSQPQPQTPKPLIPTSVSEQAVSAPQQVTVSEKNCDLVVAQDSHSKTPTTAKPTTSVSEPQQRAVSEPQQSQSQPEWSTTAKNDTIDVGNDKSAKLFTERLVKADKRLRIRWERYHQYAWEAKQPGCKDPDKKLQHSERNLTNYHTDLAELDKMGIEYEPDHSKIGKYGEYKLKIK